MSNNEQVAIVTGASAGIGLAVATELAGRGIKVAAVARGADRLNAAVDGIRSTHPQATVVAIPADVSTAAGCEHIVAETRSLLGPVTILVNNAGGSSAHPFADTTDEMWHEDLELKLHAAIRLSRAVVSDMRGAGGGSIVNILNTAAKAPTANSTPTSVSRAAGLALTKALSKEYAADQIRVNAIMIGLVKSAQWERRWEASAADSDATLDDWYANLATRVPLGRIAEAAECGALVGFLTSPAGSYITGTSINFDGGMSAVV